MTYVNGFLLAVPTANKAAYLEMATTTSDVFKKHGALAIVECWGDDVPDGKLTSFPMAVKLKADETVVFSWITWPDKATAESGIENSMKELDADMMAPDKMPFDGMRLMWGGFEAILEV